MRRAVFACLALAACAVPPGHEAFKRVMDRQVGKQADEADFYPVLYRLRVVDAKTLANGDTEEEYRAGPKGDCRLFFEETSSERRIVRWRFEGGERECVLVVPQR
jgi:hypothetical protein